MRMRTTIDSLVRRVTAATPANLPLTFPLIDLVAQMLDGHPAWQAHDARGRWVCPYCCEPTSLVLGPGAPDHDALREVARVIARCAAFDPAAPLAFHSRDAVQRGALRPALVDRLAGQVAFACEKSEAWRMGDPAGRWLCPYCCTPVMEVDTDPRDGPSPRHVAEHLLDRCPAFAARERPVKTCLELVRKAGIAGAVVTGAPKAERPATRTGASDMAHAARTQKTMLPTPPKLEGYELACRYDAGGELARGFYDFLALGDGRLAIVAGEVRGSGIDAAMSASICRKVVAFAARHETSPVEVLVRANEELFHDLGGSTDLALFFGTLDLRARRFAFARAGFDSPLLLRPAQACQAERMSRNGAPLGSVRGSLFRAALAEVSLSLVPGDLLLIHNPALGEQRSAAGDPYDARRLAADLSDLDELDAESLVGCLVHRMTAFAGPGPCPDRLVLALRCARAPAPGDEWSAPLLALEADEVETQLVADLSPLA